MQTFRSFESALGLALNLAKTIAIPLWLDPSSTVKDMMAEKDQAWRRAIFSRKRTYLGFSTGPEQKTPALGASPKRNSSKGLSCSVNKAVGCTSASSRTTRLRFPFFRLPRSWKILRSIYRPLRPRPSGALPQAQGRGYLAKTRGTLPRGMGKPSHALQWGTQAAQFRVACSELEAFWELSE